MDREREILQKALGILVRELSPKRIYLFGSRGKKENVAGSDFDLAIELRGAVPSLTKKREIQDLLEAIAGLYSIDIVFLAEVESGFRSLILETGSLVYEQERGTLLNQAV